MYYPKRFVMLNACPPKLKIQNRKLHPRHYGSAPDVVHQLQHARRVSIKSWAGTVPILLNRSIVVTHTACREWMRCHPVHSDTLSSLAHNFVWIVNSSFSSISESSQTETRSLTHTHTPSRHGSHAFHAAQKRKLVHLTHPSVFHSGDQTLPCIVKTCLSMLANMLPVPFPNHCLLSEITSTLIMPHKKQWQNSSNSNTPLILKKCFSAVILCIKSIYFSLYSTLGKEQL